MRTEYDLLIRKIADATNLDFYYVERMFLKMINSQLVELKDKIKKLEESHARIEEKLNKRKESELLLGENWSNKNDK